MCVWKAKRPTILLASAGASCSSLALHAKRMLRR